MTDAKECFVTSGRIHFLRSCLLDPLKYELPQGTRTLDMNDGKIWTISDIFHRQWFYSIGLGGMPMVFNGSLPSPKRPIGSNGVNGWKATIGIGLVSTNRFWRDVQSTG